MTHSIGLKLPTNFETRLAHFLRDRAGRRFRLGHQDCGLILADWCLSEIGIDPARDFRGRYETIDEAQQLLGVSSLPMVFGRLCRSAAIPLTKRPSYGGVAMVELEGSVRGAIRTSGYVVLSPGAGISRVGAARLAAA